MFRETEEHRRRSLRMWRLLALGVVAAVAVVGGGGADASPAEGPSARSTHAPTVPAVRAATASYLFKAEFGVGYEIDWTEASGNQIDPCNEWRLSRGTTEVHVGSYDPKRKTSLALPGRIVITARLPVTKARMTLVAVGPAQGTAHRTLIETGGSTACGDTVAPPFVAPANDCGGGVAHPYKIPNAALMAAGASGITTLDQVSEINTPASAAKYLTIAIAAPPRVPLYRNCRMSGYAREYPAYLKLPVKKADTAALLKLKPGETRRIERTWTGPCKDDVDIPQEAACRFKLDLHVDIRRWRPGEPYP